LISLLTLALTIGCAGKPAAEEGQPAAVPPGSSPEARLLRNAPSYRNVPLPPQHGTHTHDRYTEKE
jgi:hypothetical protein